MYKYEADLPVGKCSINVPFQFKTPCCTQTPFGPFECLCVLPTNTARCSCWMARPGGPSDNYKQVVDFVFAPPRPTGSKSPFKLHVKNSSSVSFLTKCPCAVVNLLAGLHGTIYGFIDEKKTSGPLGGSWLRNMSPPSTGNNVKLML